MLFRSGDPDDDPIVQTAIAAKADYLVTSDLELLRVGRIEDIEIITPTDFQQRLGVSV